MIQAPCSIAKLIHLLIHLSLQGFLMKMGNSLNSSPWRDLCLPQNKACIANPMGSVSVNIHKFYEQTEKHSNRTHISLSTQLHIIAACRLQFTIWYLYYGCTLNWIRWSINGDWTTLFHAVGKKDGTKQSCGLPLLKLINQISAVLGDFIGFWALLHKDVGTEWNYPVLTLGSCVHNLL